MRQGCPLSPLLFAVISDVLIRRALRMAPLITLRAYADDIAVVLPNAFVEARILENIFTEYRAISGLRLHHGKTVWVPLTLQDEAAVRSDLQQQVRNWGDFSIRRYATYLGFCMGPDRGDRSWVKAVAKFQERALLWRRIGCGPFNTILAYRIYIIPVLSFLVQLLNPPATGTTSNATSARHSSEVLGAGLPRACSATSARWASRRSSLTCTTSPMPRSAGCSTGRTRTRGAWTSRAGTRNWSALSRTVRVCIA